MGGVIPLFERVTPFLLGESLGSFEHRSGDVEHNVSMSANSFSLNQMVKAVEPEHVLDLLFVSWQLLTYTYYPRLCSRRSMAHFV